MKRKIALFTILTICMLMASSLIAVAVAGKPVKDGNVALQSLNAGALQIDVSNTGSVPIAKVSILITAGPTVPSANFYSSADWTIEARADNYAVFATSGKTVVKEGQSVSCGQFSSDSSVSYTVNWYLFDRKGGEIDHGILTYTPSV